MVKLSNPLGFTPWPVTIISTLSFVALFAALLTTHNIVPPTPSSAAPTIGVNLTTAWHDLQVLTNGFHPYNSARNDQVRAWLLERINDILKNNGVKSTIVEGHQPTHGTADSAVYIFDDMTSNLTWSVAGSPLTVAFAGTNIMIYIRGSDDPSGSWWEASEKDPEKYLTMINAHYDSVSSGYGATDDGVGVISVLQVISHFTAEYHQPRRGIVALLNNGEEDFLNGAYAFSQHPISKHVHTFLNLEGAGAGGRAALFRSTDTEVTRFYAKSPRPFGSVASADGFKRRLVRSETDYSVFHPMLGMRGLDVAFIGPRSRYHTTEDSARYTSKRSLWHMLSAALATMDGLASDTSSDFSGKSLVEDGVEAGQGSDGVWFDVLGRTFAVLKLYDFFAISVSLLVVAPVLLIIITAILSKIDKWYLFGRKAYPDMHRDDEVVSLGGWRGFFRTPLVVALSSTATIALTYLVMKVNPYICYSSEYSVWSMTLTAWFVISWVLLKGLDTLRPSAFQRTFALLWIFIILWVVLIGDTILENNFHIAGGYPMVIYFAGVFVALLISCIELFALPKKTIFAQIANGYDVSSQSRPETARSDRDGGHVADVADDADERTSLLRGDDNRTSFGRGYGARAHANDDAVPDYEDVFDLPLPKPFGREQKWSGKLPSWTWILQFLCLAPVPILLIGHYGLYISTATHQTSSDGSPVITLFLTIAILSILLLLPLLPFLHRLNAVIPTLLFLICIATTIYNLVAHPFSEQARLKVFFVQQVNLDTGYNRVNLIGVDSYVEKIARSIPSASGQDLNCTNSPGYSNRAGLSRCTWTGPAPNVLNDPTTAPEKAYASLISFNVTRPRNLSSSAEATFHIRGRNTKNCRILFDTPVTDINVRNYSSDPRFYRVQPDSPTKELRLWSREFGGSWVVDVKWSRSQQQQQQSRNASSFEGRVVCLWSDANDPKTVPAFSEVGMFMPTWSMVTKQSDGLVEGYKKFKV